MCQKALVTQGERNDQVLCCVKSRCYPAKFSPASQPRPKYRTGKKTNYRRFWPFSCVIIGGFERNFRRFINFEDQLQELSGFVKFIFNSNLFVINQISTFSCPKKGTSGQPLFSTKIQQIQAKKGLLYMDYMRFFEAL